MREIVWATYFDRVSGSTCCEYITADSILSKDPDERLLLLKGEKQSGQKVTTSQWMFLSRFAVSSRLLLMRKPGAVALP